MVTSHIGLSSLNSCFPSLPRPCFTKRKPFAVAAMSDDPISEWILSDGNATQITRTSSIGGGCINNARHYDTDAGSFFAKTNRGIKPSMFEGETLGLGAMFETRTIQVPGPFNVGPLPTSGSYISMEYIEFGVCRGNQFVLGRKLAEMHKAGKSEKGFGFIVHNTIGRIWQAPLFENIDKEPFLLHGDSWSGNISSDKNGKPVTLDPACYYGHSEAEFGMSWCASFGGSFYNACFECPVLKCLVMPPTVLPCQCQGNSCHSLAQPCNSGSSIWIPKGKVASTTHQISNGLFPAKLGCTMTILCKI